MPARFVAALARCVRIALRAAPAGARQNRQRRGHGDYGNRLLDSHPYLLGLRMLDEPVARQGDRDGCPFAQFACDVEFSVVHLDELFRIRKPQTGSAFRARMRRLDLLKGN